MTKERSHPPAPHERIVPAGGQESVWDYPRPPRLEQTRHRLVVVFGGELVAHTESGYRVLETSHPPVYYFPPKDVRMRFLEPNNRKTVCEFKGQACYWTLRVGDRCSEAAAWCYPHPMLAYAPITNHFAFHPAHVDACYVDGHRVEAQAGDFYGGWITPWIVGPFKGGPGTWEW